MPDGKYNIEDLISMRRNRRQPEARKKGIYEKYIKRPQPSWGL